MKTRTLFSRALAAVLALLMLVGILPAMAFAAEDEESGIASQAVETDANVIRLPITIRDAYLDWLLFESEDAGITKGDVKTELSEDGVPQYTDAAIQKLALRIAASSLWDYGYKSTDAQPPYQELASLLMTLDDQTTWLQSYDGSKWVTSISVSNSTWKATANTNWNWNKYGNERVENLEDAETVTAAADWMLRHLFADGSFTVNSESLPYTNTYNGYENLVLQPGTYTDGTACYYYDSGENTAFDYSSSGEIYNDDGNTEPDNGGWFPLDHTGTQTHPYKTTGNTTTVDTSISHNYHTTTQGSGQFVYHKDDDLFFAFTGDDDVYLYINGKLVIDDGGIHDESDSVVYLEKDVADTANKNVVTAENGKTWAEYLGLEEGETYSFDFFQMERKTNASNFAIWTNINIVNSSAVPNKKAYQNGRELIYGSFVPQNSEVTYGFELTNDGNETVTDLTFKDDLLGVYLTANADETLELGGNAVTDLEYAIYTAEQTPAYKKLTTVEELQELLKTGIKKGETISIRGFKYNVGTPEGTATTKTISNTVYTTAVGLSKTGTPMTISGSASMRIRTWNINNVAFVMDYAQEMSLSNGDVFGTELTDLSKSTTITDADNTTTKIELRDEVGNVKLDSEAGLYGTMTMTGSSIADYGLSYTPNSILNGMDSFIVQITVDTTTTIGTATTTGSNIMNKSVSIIPANNVYYEDTLVTTSKETGSVTIVNNGNGGNNEKAENNETGTGAGVHGWEDSLADDTKYSNGSATEMTTGATATFTFTGTGVDVYSYTDMTTGAVTAKIQDVNGNTSTKYLMVDNLAVSGKYYQIPTLSFQDLAYGTYTVTLVVNNAKAPETNDDGSVKVDKNGDIVYSETATRNTYYLDGIRVYNPLGQTVTDKTVIKAYLGEEASTGVTQIQTVFKEARDLLAGIADNGTGNSVFIDLDENGKTVTKDYDSEEYGTYGPKNEVYLKQGQAITFSVAGATKYYVGLKSPTAASVKATVSYGTDASGAEVTKAYSIEHSTDLYYEVIPHASKVMIKNTGDSDVVLSVTKIQAVQAITTDESGAGAATVEFMPMTDEEAVVYATSFASMEVVEADEDDVPVTPVEPEEPETPDVEIENPEPEEKPDENQALKELIKSLFDKIFGWFGRR